MKPTPQVCIHCYGHAQTVYLWKYGINYLCRSRRCMDLAKRSIGFEGVFPTVGAATRRQDQIMIEKAAKAVKGAQRGRGRGVDDRPEGLRSKDYTR